MQCKTMAKSRVFSEEFSSTYLILPGIGGIYARERQMFHTFRCISSYCSQIGFYCEKLFLLSCSVKSLEY